MSRELRKRLLVDDGLTINIMRSAQQPGLKTLIKGIQVLSSGVEV